MNYVMGVLLVIVTIQAQAMEFDATEIKVRNEEFQIIRVIKGSAMLQKAKVEWEKMIPIESLPNTKWTHKLDVVSDSMGGRWLYNKEGYIAKLNKLLRPMFRVSDVSKFNEIFLGL